MPPACTRICTLPGLLVLIVTLVLGGEAFGGPPVSAAEDEPARRPNIVLILADDMGWADAGCYGHPFAQTPNIDGLAREGTRFTQAYATGVTCSPSRTGLMTSRWPARFERYPADHGFSGLATVTELLARSGYATAHFGKWHIGPEATAGTYGIGTVGTGSGEVDRDGRMRRRAGDGADRSRDAGIFEEAISFIELHVEERAHQPFYVNVWCHTPHHPVDPSAELLESFGPLEVDESRLPASLREKFAVCRAQGADPVGHLRAYLAELRALDAEIGRLLEGLDALGLADDTIVVFSSDQGPAGVEGLSEAGARPRRVRGPDGERASGGHRDTLEVRLNAMGSAGPLRGGKHGQYEGGVRVPLIVRWPGRVAVGRVDDESVISLGDWLPTVCSIAGAAFDAGLVDGEDVSASWLGERPHVRSGPLFWKTSTTRSTATIRDGRWKLHVPNSRRERLELYDVVADPGEAMNLAEERPEVVRSLMRKVAAWQATLPAAYDKQAAGE